MALAAQLSSLDGLPADVASEYTAGEGGVFTLDVTPTNGFSLENVVNLKSALGTERGNAKTATERLALFGDLEPTAAKDAVAKVAGMANWTPDDKVKEQIDAGVKQVTDRHTTESEAMKTSLADVTKRLHGRVIEGDARRAIIKAGGNPELLLPVVTAQLQPAFLDGKDVAQVIDAQGHVRVSMASGSTKDMSVTELVEAMKGDESYAPAFSGSGASGGGAGGSGGSGGAGGSGVKVDTIKRGSGPEFTAAYRVARERAHKAGRRLEIVD